MWYKKILNVINLRYENVDGQTVKVVQAAKVYGGLIYEYSSFYIVPFLQIIK